MNDLTAQVNEAIFCPLCDTKGLFVYKGLQGKLLSVPGSWDLLECANELCGLAWLFPRPTGGRLSGFTKLIIPMVALSTLGRDLILAIAGSL
jgi:hypothetical protein